MKTSASLAAAAALISSAYAQGWPSCANDCLSKDWGSSYSSLCADSGKVDAANSCMAGSSCSEADKNSVYQWIAQACANSGVTLSQPPEATWSATSGGSNYPPGGSGWGGPGNGHGNGNGHNGNGEHGGGNWGYNGWSPTGTASSAWASYTSAHPNGPSSGDWASFTSAYGVSNGPWGSGTPTGSWATYITGGPGGPNGGHGWNPGMGGPFGAGGRNGGWGPWGSSGAWTSGPWTSWWNGNGAGNCPASDWPGWTSGSWSASADWTSWKGCTASTTATAVVTGTVSGVPYTSTSFGYQVAQADNSGTAGATALPTVSVSTGAGAAGKTIAGGAALAGLLGFVAAL